MHPPGGKGVHMKASHNDLKTLLYGALTDNKYSKRVTIKLDEIIQ